MFAVGFQTSSSIVGFGWLAVLLVVAAGAAPLVAWMARAIRSQLARRFLLAVAFAIVIALTMGARTAYAFYIGPCLWEDWWWAWMC